MTPELHTIPSMGIEFSKALRMSYYCRGQIAKVQKTSVNIFCKYYELCFMNDIAHTFAELLAHLETASRSRGLYFLGLSSLEIPRDASWFSEWLSEGRQAGIGVS